MGLKRNVVVSIHCMSNGLAFEIRYIVLRNFQGCWDLDGGWPLGGFGRVGLELTGGSPRVMRSWLI